MTRSTSSASKSFPRKSPDLKDLYKNIEQDLREVERKLESFSRSPNPLVAEVSSYIFQKSGKRIRPALLTLCSKLFDHEEDERIFLASLVEIIHTASLIHDDIIDKSEKRRGRQSVHARWGPNITVLLGDYLYIKSIGLSLRSKHDRVITILADISAQMIEGELTEYYLSGNLDIAEEDYLDIISKKTASLFSASCLIGGILGRASSKQEALLAEYGTNLGMSFQIIDDILDFEGQEEKLGKPVLSDLSEGRITLPLIHALKQESSSDRRQLKNLLSQRFNLKKEGRMEILDLLRSNGSLDYAYRKAMEFSLKSEAIISRFPQSVHRETLSLFPNFVLNRKK